MGKEYRQNDLWAVQLDEGEWYGISEDAQDRMRKATIARGRVENCSVVCIMVKPDDLFPMCGHTKNHRVFEYIILGHNNAPFHVATQYVCEIEADAWWQADHKTQGAILDKAREQLNANGLHVPGRYTIQVKKVDGTYKELERGRV